MRPADYSQKNGAHHGIQSEKEYDFVETSAAPVRAEHVHDVGSADDECAPQGHGQIQIIVSKMPFDLFDVLPVSKYVGRKKESKQKACYRMGLGHSAE